MTDDDKLRFILIVSAIVAALAVHRFLEPNSGLAQSMKQHSIGVRSFNPISFGLGRD
jgi:hypothetical protein